MAEPITAIYVQEDEDWSVTVSGHGKTLTGHAPGIIAARDNVDQLVESLGPDAKGATVVHLLNGSALEFTAAYMTARLARPEVTAPESPMSEASDAASSDAASLEVASSEVASSDAESSVVAADVPEQQSEERGAAKPQNKASRRPKAKLTADIGDALEKKATVRAAQG
ncbi:hypothetical protein SAMN05421835_102431 [Amycolatopsis sacchari]|uniref:Uncharacterized protein n=1 Tax=Amycolatopsis sacchari TaxID=115433 RepID=A0A1I3MRE4_9PSEU|nr:hypothetical protein [Amycolatopsis sacchari]SFI99236.1 hypothetical protein SAMN05421835_102431 [Amycolatopsis sacchari]